MTTHAILLLAAVAGAAACGSTTGPDDASEVALTVSPDPATAVASHGVFYDTVVNDVTVSREYPWEASFAVSIQESGGVALTISAVQVRVQQASGGVVIVPPSGEVEKYELVSTTQSGGNHLSANGSTSMNLRVVYELPNGGREALVTVTFLFVEDDVGDSDGDGVVANDGTAYTQAVQARVQ
jgi:hypothetical protein